MMRVVLLVSAFALTAACGQKGALYLPPKNGAVVTRPAGAASGSTAPSTTPAQTTSPSDTTTLPSTPSEASPSGQLRQDAGPATQATDPKQSGDTATPRKLPK